MPNWPESKEKFKEFPKMAEKDQEITLKEVQELQKETNAHAIAWSLVFSSGMDHNHLDRIIKSRTSKSGNVHSKPDFALQRSQARK